MSRIDSYRPIGVIPAVVTPMTDDGGLDIDRYQAHLDFLVTAGVHAVMVIGGSGEYTSLLPEERKRLILSAVEVVSKRVPIIVGALSPGTAEVVDIAKYADHVGADAVMVLPPYYVRPSLQAIVEHYRVVADAAALPIVAYNNPGRTGIALDADTLEAISAVNAVVGVKDCDRDVASIAEKARRLGARLSVLSGDDDLGFATLLSGGTGGIWVTPNIAPHLCLDLYAACTSSRVNEALSIHHRIRTFLRSWYFDNHPAPFKQVMGLAGRPVGPARRPLQPMSPSQLDNAQRALADLGPSPELSSSGE